MVRLETLGLEWHPGALKANCCSSGQDEPTSQRGLLAEKRMEGRKNLPADQAAGEKLGSKAAVQRSRQGKYARGSCSAGIGLWSDSPSPFPSLLFLEWAPWHRFSACAGSAKEGGILSAAFLFWLLEQQALEDLR